MYVPYVLVETYIAYAQELSIDLKEIFKEWGVNGLYLSIEHYTKLIRHISNQVEQTDLGFEVGCRYSPDLFEPISTAIISAKNLEESLRTATHYWSIFGTGINLKITYPDKYCSLEVSSEIPIEKEVETIVLKSLLVFLSKFLIQLTSRQIDTLQLFFKDSKTSQNIAFFAENISLCNNSDAWKINFPLDLLDSPNFFSNRLSYKKALHRCHQIMNNTSDCNGVLFNQASIGTESLENFASKQSVSAKTLYRHLKQTGQSYRQLSQKKKYDQAIRLLRHSQLSIEEISDKLGYSDACNFSRAFKKWEGLSPRNYRNNYFILKQ